MNAEGLALLKEFEGFRSEAYPDPATGGKPWTIGYGFTDGVRPGDRMSRAQADQRLGYEIEKYETAVLNACTLVPNENQLAAMTCFAFNVGIAGFKKSSVLKAHNRGDFQSAARAFGLWNKAAGKVMAGLTRRRAAESALYLKPIGEAQLPMPQAVTPEGTLLKSPVMLTSATTGTVATVSAVAEGTRGVREIKENLGEMLPWIIAGVAVVVTGFLMLQRYRQRRNGWA